VVTERTRDVAADPWARYRSSEVAEARAGRVLCGFHRRNPDVGDDYDDPRLGEPLCPDCDTAAAHDALADQGPDPDSIDWGTWS
jgi:hypothetical protein